MDSGYRYQSWSCDYGEGGFMRQGQLNPSAAAFIPQRHIGTAGNCSQNNTRIISAPQNSGFSGSGRSRRRGKLFLLLHGIACSYCGEICLDPEDPVQRQEHVQECLQRAEEMEIMYAVARSRDKECGICLEVIIEKLDRDRRFGILPDCVHCFCLTCIMKWRENQEVDENARLSCPECRIPAGFICPSDFWVQNKEDKQDLISDYLRSQAIYNYNRMW